MIKILMSCMFNYKHIFYRTWTS